MAVLTKEGGGGGGGARAGRQTPAPRNIRGRGNRPFAIGGIRR